MNTIDISTTQNVTIEYKLARVIERFVAWLLDYFIMSVGTLLLYFIIVGILQVQNETIIGLIGLVVVVFYHLTFETLNHGQSPGKMIMKIKVIKLSGETPSLFDYLIRWAFRLVDIALTSGLVAVLSISSSNRNQRVGDYLADMVVIKVSTGDRIGLDSVMRISQLKSYVPRYPEVRAYTEQDMLLIKETLDRVKKFPTPGHKKALEVLANKVQSQLQVKREESQEKFLNTLIKDYVVLTR